MPSEVTEAQIVEYLQALREAPRRISVCTRGIDEARLKTPPAPSEWSTVEIMAHVRGAAEARGRTIHQMLVLDNPKLPYVSPRGWMKKQKYDQLSFAENFQAYQLERENLIRVLQGLTIDQWNRSATFTGKSKTSTVFDEVMRIAQHDLDHCHQVEALFPSNKSE